MQEVLIVTCDRDRWQFLLQCKSIGKFLEPTKVVVVINEIKPQSWLEWFQEQCQQFLQKHHITVLQREYFFDLFDYFYIHTSGGWKTQQIFKMLYAYKTNESYLVLDSKNWFVKPIKLSEITPRQRRCIDQKSSWHEVFDATIIRFNLPQETACRPIFTPYKFEPGIVKDLILSFGSVTNFVSWFMKFKQPGEFIVYDLYAQSIDAETEPGNDLILSRNFWYGTFDSIHKQNYSTELDLRQLERTINDPTVKIVGIASRLVQDIALRPQIERLLPLN